VSPRSASLVRVVAAAVFLGFALRSAFVIDDAFISFRYASNWAEWGEPVYNRGEFVEGYSNFLWVFLLRVLAELGVALPAAATWISLACALATVALVEHHLRRDLKLAPAASAAGVFLLACFPPFQVWATGGLESAAHALLLFATYRLLAAPGDDRKLGLLAGLSGLGLVLIRVEGVAWLGAALVGAWFAGRCHGPGSGRPRFGVRALACLAPALLGFAVFLAWRHATYGEWLANTAAAKGGTNAAVWARGLRTIASYALLFVTPLVALLAIPLATSPRRLAAVGASAVFAAFLLFNAVVGGDWMPMFRLLAPASPFVAVLVALALERAGRGLVPLAATLAAVQLLPAFDVHLLPHSLRDALYFRTFRVGYETEWERWSRSVENGEAFERMGRALAVAGEPTDSITLGPIGAVGFYSGLHILDRNGLVEPSVAGLEVELGTKTAGHDRRVPRAFFLDREPTYFEVLLWPGPMTADRWPGFQEAARGMAAFVFSDPAERALQERCVVEELELPGDGEFAGTHVLVLRRVEDPAVARSFWASLLPR